MSGPTLTGSERLTLEIVLAIFEFLCALACAFMAWRSGRNPIIWFFIGLIPIIGIFASLFFIEMPLRDSEANTGMARHSKEQSRKLMGAQERRVAFGLICLVVLLAALGDSIKIPKWLTVVLFFGGVLVVFAVAGGPPKKDKPDA